MSTISRVDHYAQAGYVVPADLPSFGSYLFAKYPDLPSEAVAELQQRFKELLARHGIQIEELVPVTEELPDASIGEIT